MRGLILGFLLVCCGCSHDPLGNVSVDLLVPPAPVPFACDSQPDAGITGCDDGEWSWAGPAPQGYFGAPWSVWGTSVDNAWFLFGIQDGPIRQKIFHWDGERFTTEWSQTSNDYANAVYLHALWGSSDHDVWAVGSQGAILHSTGGGCWARVSSGTGENLMAIAGSAPDDVWAVGTHGTAVHWDGGGWSVIPTHVQSDVTAIAATDGATWIGTSGGELLAWDGSVWRVQASVFGKVDSLWAAGKDDAWAVGEKGTVLRWNGTAWSQVLTGCDWWSGHVWGTRSDNVWLGSCHWDGVSFGSDAAAPRYPSGNAGDAWSFDAQSTLHWDGATWSTVLDTNDFTAIAPLSDHDVWAVGTYGGIHHFDGRRWTRAAWFYESFLSLHAIARDDVWAGGRDGGIYHWDGESWTVSRSADPKVGMILSLWGSGPNDVWAIGRDPLHFDGKRWTVTPIGDQFLSRVWGSASDDVWVMSSLAVAHHFDGTRWTDVPTGTKGGSISDVWGLDRNHVWATGVPGLLRWNGTAWSMIDLGIKGADLGGVRGRSDDDLWLIGPGRGASVWHWDGQGLRCTIDLLTYLRGMGGTPDDLWVVGNNGTILHRRR